MITIKNKENSEGCKANLLKFKGSLFSNVTQKFREVLVFVVVFISNIITLSSPLYANPTGGQVAAGSAIIQQAPNSTVINQSSQKAIINWNSFNIGAQESTHFQQPVGGVTLNRINPSQGVSQIFGTLTATGRIILINSAGIYFGPSAYVNVGGLIASTADIRDQDFLNDHYQFTQNPSYTGSIVNEGTIIAADHGLVALVGTNVTNLGLIQANLGQVVLASGSKFTMSFAGNDMISFSVDEGTDNNSSGKSNITNSGVLRANGGKILVTAKTAQGVLNNVVNMTGVAEAKSVGMQNGEIVLLGEGGGVNVSGKLIASGKNKGEQGGRIKILAKRVQVNHATVDVSGDVGGGEILIGGNAHGAGPEINAQQTYVGKDVVLNADAISKGNGGKVVVWSDDATQFYGSISAKGGLLSGNGGWIETSGKNLLDVNNAVINTTAPHGVMGTWLLDPTNIYIANNLANATAAGMAGSDATASRDPSTSPDVFTAGGVTADSLLTTTTLLNALGTTNVVVTTTNTSGTGVGNITVVDPISWATANQLTLTAASNIFLNAAITMSNASANLILNATGNVTQTAAIGGAGGLIKQGTGTATLSLANTYTGATVVNAGVLAITNANALGGASGGAITVNSGTLSVKLGGATLANNASTMTLNGAGTGGIGSSALYNADTSGTNTIQNPIVLGSAATIGSNTGGTLLLSGNITNGANLLTITGGGNLTTSGVIGSGAGGIAMNGTGTFTLTGANTYSGATSINGGNFVLSGANGSVANSVFTVNQGGVLTLNNTTANNNNRLNNTNALTLAGGEFVVIGNASANTAETLGALTLPTNYSTVT